MSDFRAAGPEDSVLGTSAAKGEEEVTAGARQLASDAAAPAQVNDEPEQSLADEYLALAQRTQADFENYRKRMARELDSAKARGVSQLAKELLPALDGLDRALSSASGAPVVDEQLIEGLRLVQRELVAALERVGIERFGEPGESFDPVLHEAVAHQPFDGFPAGGIVEVYQGGYSLGGTVIRPARVLVAA